MYCIGVLYPYSKEKSRFLIGSEAGNPSKKQPELLYFGFFMYSLNPVYHWL